MSSKFGNCLVTYLSTRYEDAFTLAGIICIGNLAEFLVLYPVLPILMIAQERRALQLPWISTNYSNVQPSETKDSIIMNQEPVTEVQVNDQISKSLSGTFFGLSFTSYLVLVSFVYIAFTVTIMALIFSLDDPRPIWKNFGWKQAVGAQELLVTGFVNGVFYVGWWMDELIEASLEATDSLMEEDEYMYPHWSYYAYYFSFRSCFITLLITLSFYYPYMVTYLLSTCFTIVVVIGLVCSCCLVVVWGCVWVVVWAVLQTLFENDYGKKKLGGTRDSFASSIAMFIAGLSCFYVLQVLVIMFTFLASGGQTGRPVCVHNAKGIGFAVLSNYSGILIGIGSWIVKKALSQSSTVVEDDVDEEEGSQNDGLVEDNDQKYALLEK